MAKQVVGRQRELELVRAALASGAHILLEGPPGTGKSTLLRQVAAARHAEFVLVEGSAELTPARLIGSFDPALVLEQGYRPENFSDGPLVRAMRDGGLLYVEELNRVPEETINVLLTVMSEGEINVPRLGRVAADESFRLVAAMNPYDSVGTSRLSMALYDRTCRISVGYQDAEHERQIVQLAASRAKQALVAEAVGLARATREHPDLRSGASVRGAIDYARLVPELAEIRAVPADDWQAGLDAALTTLSGRVRRHESCQRSADQVIEEIFRRVRAAAQAGDPSGGEANPGEMTSPLRAPQEHAVLSFAGSVEVIRPLVSDVAPAVVAERLLRMRGHGVTRLAAALKAAGEQLAPARARRRVVILLSDCRSTDDDDTLEMARALTELIILAPADDHEQAAHLAALAGARWGVIAHPLDAAAVLDRLLETRATA